MPSNYSRALKLFASAGTRLRTFWAAKGWVVALIVLPFLALWVGLIIMGPWLNTVDRQEWKCEVVSAEPKVGGAGLRGGALNASVEVQTKNCGEIILEGRAVDFDNKETVAASLEPGSEWIFEIGWFARNYSMKIERVSPSTQYYHRAG
ncbi:hypothetical protein [Arthrobacter sp. S41]|uniref:hypothetical protein n=1 Tax=Arthrobacter sp. S41 TaxID=2509721 RepID=UPI0010358C4E|nr:hypothetical protein [Arthrobacter sp. S41]TAP25229.1 hypothetical protein EYR88_15340 [Arthrobacter sp. S41]